MLWLDLNYHDWSKIPVWRCEVCHCEGQSAPVWLTASNITAQTRNTGPSDRMDNHTLQTKTTSLS